MTTKMKKGIEPAAAGLQPLSMWHHVRGNAMHAVQRRSCEMVLIKLQIKQEPRRPSFPQVCEGNELKGIPL